MSYQRIKKIKGNEYLYEMESYRENGKIKNRIIKYHGNIKKPTTQLIYKQNLSLERKISYSLGTIVEFYLKMKGQVYISFSGGKDSTVLLHLVRTLFPNVPAVFVDTGMEFPEVRDFVKTIPNVIWLKPDIPFTKVLTDYGFPVVSKLVSTQVRVMRNPTARNEKTRSIYEEGYKNENGIDKRFKMSNKWKFLIDAPFKISEKCCKIMKHDPISKFEKKTELKPYIGTMASDSMQRRTNYLKTTCNSFNGNPKSRPLSIWNENDVWDYIHQHNVSYSKIYDLGWERTGCAFCLYGCHLEKDDRFERMKETHPQLHNYCMKNLGLKKKIKFIKNGI